MLIRSWIARTEIKLLLKYYPFQVRDILAEQKKHLAYNPGCKPVEGEVSEEVQS